MSIILTGQGARESIKKGIDIVADAVAITAGPMGKNVTIAQDFGAHIITNDGVTVARAITPPDAAENMGAHMAKEVGTNAEETTGDGTTTAIILLQSLVDGGQKMLAAGAEPHQLKMGMSIAANKIVELLDKMSVPVKGNATIKKVATISANNDPILGGLIAEAFYEAGDAGEVAVTDSGTFDTYVKLLEGMKFDRGFLHRAFINNTQEMRADLIEPNILITDKRINSSEDLSGILEKLSVGKNNTLLLISTDISSDVLQVLAMAKLQGQIDITCVKAPGFGDSQIEMLEDLAAITGATVIGAAHDIRETTLDHLGSADKVYAGKDETTIIGGHGDTDDINNRITNILSFLDDETLDDYPKQILQKRLGNLNGGVAVLYIGAGSDTELAEKKYRIEDAIGATRSAIAEGIVPGGGLALIRATQDLNLFNTEGITKDEEMGIMVVLEAVKRPFKQILVNAGISPDTVLSKIEKKNEFYGLNVKTGKFGDLMKLGVIDPVKVTKMALLNAVSNAGMFLTTGATIYNEQGE